jgi:hypothetical protein
MELIVLKKPEGVVRPSRGSFIHFRWLEAGLRMPVEPTQQQKFSFAMPVEPTQQQKFSFAMSIPQITGEAKVSAGDDAAGNPVYFEEGALGIPPELQDEWVRNRPHFEEWVHDGVGSYPRDPETHQINGEFRHDRALADEYVRDMHSLLRFISA